ncbi:hypothetical protein [Gottfriedia acidiceleris]|uniref:Uncharacterized protein n=1 Tax=Gottfriedia acidiceleris TaxID=371036 RepID=A0ABY4JPV1_9BACI|nr:hypothetical protein [Gottfriedia acidiceleris]UPM55873.1 hypothetical protein MY490_08600 [Gottfriedia acidiceleris]
MKKRLLYTLSIVSLLSFSFSTIAKADTEIGTVTKGMVMFEDKQATKPFRVENQVGASVPAHVLESSSFNLTNPYDQVGYSKVKYIDYDKKYITETTNVNVYTLAQNIKGYESKSFKNKHSFTSSKGLSLKPVGNGWYSTSQKVTTYKKTKLNGKTKTIKTNKEVTTYIPSSYVKKTKKTHTQKKALWEKHIKEGTMWFKTSDVQGLTNLTNNPISKVEKQTVIELINGMEGYKDSVNDIDFKVYLTNEYDADGYDLSEYYFGYLHMFNSVGQPSAIANKLSEIYGQKVEFVSKAGIGHSDTTYYISKTPIFVNP